MSPRKKSNKNRLKESKRIRSILDINYSEYLELKEFDNKKFSHQKPLADAEEWYEKVHRRCLGPDCENVFVAIGRFNRLCEICRYNPIFSDS